MKSIKCIFFVILFLPTYLSATTTLSITNDWSIGQAHGNTLFTASQFKDNKIINSINIFKMDAKEKSVQELMEKIRKHVAKSVGDGYIIKSITNYDMPNCYLLDVHNVVSKMQFNQVWCSSSDTIIATQITDFHKIDAKTRNEISNFLRGKL